MHRLCAALLLALIGFPPMVPAIIAQTDPKLPSCCRREGKHHCGMANMAAQSSGVGARDKCASYPSAPAFPPFSNQLAINRAQVWFAAVVKHPAMHFQTEALLRISFNRSRQKRGPPVCFS